MSQVKLLASTFGAARRGLGIVEVLSGEKKIKLPLKSVELTGRVADRLAQVTVNQSFSNPFNEHLEAVYIFPLSGGCAVSSFEMLVGDRVVKGKVEERGAARAVYAEAIEQGKRTALLEQERDDVFTVQVGNLPPGQEVTVNVTYSEKLPYFEDGTTEIRLPLVVAPRYIPGAPLERDSVGDGIEFDTDKVPDASRISPPRLAAGVDPKVKLKLKVVLTGNQTVEDLSCTQHVTKMGAGADGITVSLSREDELLDRDFVLRWRVASDKVQSQFLIYKNPEASSEQFGMLSLVPPKCTDVNLAARDVLFVVDRSGSMQGLKMVSAARACSYLLSTLTPGDRFAVQTFDTVFEWMPAHGSKDGFLGADEAGIQNGINYLRTIDARGGTDLEGAITGAISAMKKRNKTDGRQPIIVVLTDGQVGNEANIVGNIQKQLGDLRVFTVGIDTAVNAGFLKKLAAIGGGTATFVEPGTQLEEALSQVSREIGTPLIEELSITDINCGFDSNTMAPNKMPDLFEGRAVTAFFQLSGNTLPDLSKAAIRVTGKFTDGTPFVEEVTAHTTEVSALPQLWAKANVVDKEDKYRLLPEGSDKNKLYDEIVALAKQHSLLTKFTAFVLVDEAEIVNAQGSVRKVLQPVQDPALWANQQQAQSQGFMSLSAAESPAWGAAMPASMPASMTASLHETGTWRASASSDGGRARAESLGRAVPPPSPQQRPSAPPPPGGSIWGAPGAGSYGSGVRAQVFEVLVRQAIAGAPWRELCAGPMQVNNISPEEVQREIDRRLNLQGQQFKPAQSNEMVEIVLLMELLEKGLNDCFQQLESGQVPSTGTLETLRTKLLEALAKSSIAGLVPLLQKYLRSDLVKLITALSSASTVNNQLKKLGAAQKKGFESLRSEVEDIAKPPAKEKFWSSTV